MEEPALIDSRDPYCWLDYGSCEKLFVIDELWAQSLQLFPNEKIYLPLGGDNSVFKPSVVEKDIDILFLDTPSLPEDDLSTKFGRKKYLNWLRNESLYPFVLKGNISSQKLNQFYNRAKVVIYINPLLLKTDFSNVVYDVLLSGSFLLTDYKTNADKLFDGKLATFKNLDQLIEKTNYFLNYQEETRERAEILRKIVLERHTISKRQELIKQQCK